LERWRSCFAGCFDLEVKLAHWWQRSIQEQGFAILPDIVTPGEVAELLEKICEDPGDGLRFAAPEK
jgi:hypothetical protein